MDARELLIFPGVGKKFVAAGWRERGQYPVAGSSAAGGVGAINRRYHFRPAFSSAIGDRHGTLPMSVHGIAKRTAFCLTFCNITATLSSSSVERSLPAIRASLPCPDVCRGWPEDADKVTQANSGAALQMRLAATRATGPRMPNARLVDAMSPRIRQPIRPGSWAGHFVT